MIEQLINYLRDTLGVTLTAWLWDQKGRLPFFLQDSYSYYVTELDGLDLVLMVDNGREQHSPAMIRKHMDLVRNIVGGEAIYVHKFVSALDRKRLIGQRVSFIVPGNQLYCPMLGMDLRENFRQKSKAVQVFSPATQGLALYWLYNNYSKDDNRDTVTEMAKILGYSKMTMSRAFKEIGTALDTVQDDNFAIHEVDNGEWDRGRWEKLRSFWRSPIKKGCYLLKDCLDHDLFYKAGLMALADYTMLAEPSHEIYAIGQQEWTLCGLIKDTVDVTLPDEQVVEVQVWSYSPRLFANEQLVDPLSLYLSLRDNKDERVESALNELLEQVKW